MAVGIQFRSAHIDDLDVLATLEAASYPADEAATRSTLQKRLRVAPECTLVGEQDGHVAGFICGTRTQGQTLTHASMHDHAPEGASLCIHSVVVALDMRRQSVGLQLLEAYQAHARSQAGVERVLLITKAYLIEFYQTAGFTMVGPSAVVHGQDPWFEMRCELKS